MKAIYKMNNSNITNSLRKVIKQIVFSFILVFSTVNIFSQSSGVCPIENLTLTYEIQELKCKYCDYNEELYVPIKIKSGEVCDILKNTNNLTERQGCLFNSLNWYFSGVYISLWLLANGTANEKCKGIYNPENKHSLTKNSTGREKTKTISVSVDDIRFCKNVPAVLKSTFDYYDAQQGLKVGALKTLYLLKTSCD